MTDIVERLRSKFNAWNSPLSEGLPDGAAIMLEAADEIERLRALSKPEGKAEAVASYKTENKKRGWTGRYFEFEGGSLYLDKEGNGTLVFDDEALSYEPQDEDDRRQYRGAVVASSELIALCDYLRSAFQPSGQTRAEIIEECAKVAEWAHMVPPDGGSPTEEERAVAEAAARNIRALAAQGKEP